VWLVAGALAANLPAGGNAPRGAPKDNPMDYALTLRSVADPDDTPEGGVYVEVLRVDGRSRRALEHVVRVYCDGPWPIGLFGGVLSDAQVRAIPAGIDAVPWGSLVQAGGDRNAGVFTLEYASGRKTIRQRFNAQDGAFIKAIDPIFSVLDGIRKDLEQRPQRAMTLGVVRTAKGFRLTWRNVGVGPVMFSDPREKGADGMTNGAALVRPKAPEGGFPLSWTPVPLASSAAPPRPVVLPPGGTLTLDTAPWTPPAPGEYGASARWIDAAGPDVPEADVMPRLPGPDDLDDARPFVIRGGVFAEGFMFRVEPPR
jgi:hypothetical protein